MIPSERVYEVFGITDDTWWEELSVRPKYIRALPVIKASPEMLVALVNVLIDYKTNLPSCYMKEEMYLQWIKAIESADSKNRKWSEILKEF